MNIKYYLKDMSRFTWGVFKFFRLTNFLPDELYLKWLYKARMGKKLNLDFPETFNEKLQWLKIHDRKPVYTTMVDKYAAKEYVASIIGEEYIIPTLGVWEHFDDIDFDSLPDQFVLKCTHDSGGLVICRDKSKLDRKKARKKIEKSLKRNYYWSGREWPYKNVKPRIIAEKYMEDTNIFEMNDTESDYRFKNDLTDYKFFCFNGSPKLLYVSRGLENHTTAEISFYGLDGIEKPYHRSDYKPYHDAIMPHNFDEMKDLAEKIAIEVDCPFVRIDLYSIEGHSYFSEITFSPCSGMVPFEPVFADEELGRLLYISV